MARETFASRLGFLLMAAGCAIGLGNVWRFPFITGRYGGALFVLIYLVFLVILGFPVMVAELAIGRASQSDLAGAMKILRKPESRFHWEIPAKIAFAGNMILLMFYSVVTAWLLYYAYEYISGGIAGCSDSGKFFGTFLQNWPLMLLFTIISIMLTVFVCARGLRGGVEKTINYMMAGLFILEIVLVIYAMRLPGGWNGVKFFLSPDVSKITSAGLWPVIHAAMTQAFFTLSLGIGSIAICGSYTNKERSLSGEATMIIILDTFVAIASGLIIFPACAAFNISPDAGPSLIFITLPKAFEQMSGGRWLGMLFFIFLSIAALSTLIAVAENLIACGMRTFNWSRTRSTAIFGIALLVLSLPCLFGFNLWSRFQPFGKGSCVLDLEDFIVSSNLLPLGSIMIVLFCTLKCGWGMDNFLAEANTGKGMKFPRFMAVYMKYVVPAIILIFWSYDIIEKFFLK